MRPDDLKTPEELAQDAAQAAQGYASGAATIDSNAFQSIRSNVEDAKATGQEALDAAKGFAKDAVNAAGKKIEDLTGQINHLKARSTQHIADDPVRSIVYAAIGGALLTALLLALMRERRY